MPGFINHDLRRFHTTLADIVMRQHGERCPCCRHPMVKPRKKNASSMTRRDRKTMAHDTPVGFGGDPTVWVFACQGCNIDQKNRTFRSWSQHLERSADRRAPFVAALADTVDRYMKGHSHASSVRLVPAQTRADAAAHADG